MGQDALLGQDAQGNTPATVGQDSQRADRPLRGSWAADPTGSPWGGGERFDAMIPACRGFVKASIIASGSAFHQSRSPGGDTQRASCLRVTGTEEDRRSAAPANAFSARRNPVGH